MEATIRKDDDKHITLILDGRLDTSVTPQTEREVEPLFNYTNCEVQDVFNTTGFVHLFDFK